MPSTPPAVSRRRVLAGGAALTLLGVAATACGGPSAPEVDDLQVQLELARHDGELAAAAAAAAPPALAPPLATVSAQRSDHAQALGAEIARVTGRPSTGPQAPAPTSAAAPPSPPPSAHEVATALRASAHSAGQAAAEASGYRAGLFGSIAASCTAANTVELGAGAAS